LKVFERIKVRTSFAYVVDLSVSEGCVGGLAVFECSISYGVNLEMMTCNSRRKQSDKGPYKGNAGNNNNVRAILACSWIDGGGLFA